MKKVSTVISPNANLIFFLRVDSCLKLVTCLNAIIAPFRAFCAPNAVTIPFRDYRLSFELSVGDTI